MNFTRKYILQVLFARGHLFVCYRESERGEEEDLLLFSHLLLKCPIHISANCWRRVVSELALEPSSWEYVFSKLYLNSHLREFRRRGGSSSLAP